LPPPHFFSHHARPDGYNGGNGPSPPPPPPMTWVCGPRFSSLEQLVRLKGRRSSFLLLKGGMLACSWLLWAFSLLAEVLRGGDSSRPFFFLFVFLARAVFSASMSSPLGSCRCHRTFSLGTADGVEQMLAFQHFFFRPLTGGRARHPFLRKCQLGSFEYRWSLPAPALGSASE